MSTTKPMATIFALGVRNPNNTSVELSELLG